MRIKYICLSLLIVLLVFLSSCGRGGSEHSNDATYSGLYIFAPGGMSELAANIRNASDIIYQTSGIQVNATMFSQDERDEYMSRALSHLASGLGPDILIIDGMTNIFEFIDNGFVIDINRIIPDRTMFFENVLAGHEIDGRLYNFPLSFSYNMVGINASLPQSFISRFSAMETASLLDLTILYSELTASYPEYEAYNILHSIWFELPLNNAVNLYEREVNFPNQTANLLNNMRRYIRADNTGIGVTPTVDVYNMQTVFHIPRGHFAVPEAFFTFSEPLFKYYIPFVDNNGAMINRSFGYSILVSANANSKLAWEFILTLLEATATSVHGGRDGNIHIMQEHAPNYVLRGVNRDLMHIDLRPTLLGINDEASNAATRLIENAHRPIIRPIDMNIIPFDIIQPRFNEFVRNNDDAQITLQEMEMLLTDWLNQSRTIIPYVPADVSHLPVRRLSIHANDLHSAMFQQAADAMNESWQARGIPYIFEVEINGYDWTDWEGAEARGVRLQASLMAGQGPDLFIADTELNLRSFARNGFLANFYTLIDNCTGKNRSDFFENVLQGFEFESGLYIFPTSFSFFQVGINAHLPPTHLNRFTENNTITMNDMVEIYFNAISDERFSHLSMGVTSGWAHVRGMLRALSSDFICFASNTSELNSPLFASQLEMMRRLFQEPMWITIHYPLGLEASRIMADTQIFEMSNIRRIGTSAFFPRSTNYFINYRPLVNQEGQLIINPNESCAVWALLAINANGETELAWEFITYLLREYPYARGRARTGEFGHLAAWAEGSIATPILRANANMPRSAFEQVTGAGYVAWGWDLGDARDDYINEAMSRLADMNEMPVHLIHPMIPTNVLTGADNINLDNFMFGIITAEEFAQMMHNSVSLWMME
ncbi:MAG: hypothetical protein FWC16_09360 [Defluviitaleaceae bacterium]|nr:hypothetical protein [Defluviitaleaceae bacterium]MCL2275119.1 hypothetical protein [Defluviitaleaceae bacterium]